MFYCDPCAIGNSWPAPTLFRSEGPCEVCGRTAVCNDRPSKDLPIPARPPHTRPPKDVWATKFLEGTLGD